MFDICKGYGIKLRLRLGLNHLNEHKFKHGFNDIINLICICGGDIESINHLFLHCPEYCEARQTLFENVQSIDKMLFGEYSLNECSLTHFFLLVTLNAIPMLMHSSSTRQLNSYYLQEDSMDCYLMESNMYSFFLLFIFYMAFSFFVFCFVISYLYLYPRCL